MAVSTSPSPANAMMPNDIVYGRQLGRDVQFRASQLPTGGGTEGPQGPQGATGPAGPTSVSADAGNLAKLGTDNLLFVPKAYVDGAVTQINVVPLAPVCEVTSTASQSVTRDVLTKIQFNSAGFDNTNAFDLVNYRFKPNVAGFYQVNCGCGLAAGSATMFTTIYKNGVEFRRATTSSNSNSRVSTLIHMNGTTDYLEGYIQPAVNSTISTTPVLTSFSAALVQPSAS